MRIDRTLPTLVLIAASLLMVPVACASENAETEAVAAARPWLDLIDKGEVDKSWETAATLFKGAVTQQQWNQQIAAVRTPLGKLISREVAQTTYATSLPGAPDGEYVVIQFNTVFENKNTAVETVTPMKDADGKWKVSGYYIK